MANFAAVVKQLAEAQAITEIHSSVELANAIALFFKDEERRQEAANAAAAVAESNTAVIDSVMEELKPFLDALPPGNSDARA